MNPKIVSVGLLAVSIVGSVVGYIFDNSVQFGICVATDSITDASCLNFYERVGSGMFYGFVALGLVSILLILIQKTFNSWKKFGVWATPLLVIIFATYQGSRGFDLVSPSPEELFKWLSIAYAAISIFIIARAARKHS